MNIEAKREHEPQDGSRDETQDRHAIISAAFPLWDNEKNELTKTAHIHAPRNECGIANERKRMSGTGTHICPLLSSRPPRQTAHNAIASHAWGRGTN